MTSPDSEASPAPSTGIAPTAGARDRDDRGRPENSRPRDRTGRPLPYDTDETLLTERLDYGTVEAALDWGVRRWRQGRYFEAHECLEDVWHYAIGQDKAFWQGIIQVAVAFVHHQRSNPSGVVATCRKALRNLEDQPDHHHGIDVVGLRAWCGDAMERLSTDSTANVVAPVLTLGPDGAYVSFGSMATPLQRRGEPHAGARRPVRGR